MCGNPTRPTLSWLARQRCPWRSSTTALLQHRTEGTPQLGSRLTLGPTAMSGPSRYSGMRDHSRVNHAEDVFLDLDEKPQREVLYANTIAWNLHQLSTFLHGRIEINCKKRQHAPFSRLIDRMSTAVVSCLVVAPLIKNNHVTLQLLRENNVDV